MKQIRKKITLLVSMLLLFFVAVNGIEAKAASGSSSISVSASSVNIGDTVKVTLRVKADTYASFRMSMSYSSKILEYTGSDKGGDCNGGGGQLSVLSEVDGGSTYSITCTFKAKAPGEASISASAVEAISMETAEAMQISGAGTKITVNNQAANNDQNSGNQQENTQNQNNSGNQENQNTGTGSENTTPPTETLSKDNSLRKLTISQGTLSPEFKYSTTKYTATVDEDVTSVIVDAQTSNNKATVESVVGNNNLQMGENVIKVTVKAEDGTLAIYTITVIRGGGTTEEDTENEPEDETETLPEDTEEGEEPSEESSIVINGIRYEVSTTLPESSMPEEFAKTVVTYEEQEIEAYVLPYNELKLFYLNPIKIETQDGQETEENTGKFFVYDASLNEFFPYIYVTVGNNGVVVLPMSLSGAVPEGYQEMKFQMGEFEISGCQSLSQEEGANEFCLVYGVDKQGNAGWYKYDTLDMSLQRFQENSYIPQEEEEPQTDMEVYATQYQGLETKYKELKSKYQKTIFILVFVLVVAVITIINLLIFGKRGNSIRKEKNKDLEYIDFDEW